MPNQGFLHQKTKNALILSGVPELMIGWKELVSSALACVMWKLTFHFNQQIQ